MLRMDYYCRGTACRALFEPQGVENAELKHVGAVRPPEADLPQVDEPPFLFY